MKRIQVLLLVSLLSSVLAAQDNAVEDTLFQEINARLLVQERQAAGDLLCRWAEEQGGYFIVKNLEQVEFRLPDDAVSGLIGYLERISDEVVEFNRSTFDLREQLMSSRSALEARQEILAKNIEYIADSDVEGTLTLEQEIRRLMNEIDRYRGMLRKLENDAAFARVVVMLTFLNQTIPDSRPSRFDWINTVDFYDFMNYGAVTKQPGPGGPKVRLPEGFALIDDRPEFLAVSPEGIRMRVASYRNYPEKSAAFWEEALFAYLAGRGYPEMEQADVLDFGADPFAVRSWGVPYGNDDYIYITGLRLQGNSIEVLEIAGPARYIGEYF